MTLEMRERSIAREARKEGRLEGEAKAKLELAVMLVNDRTYTAETAAQKCGVDLEELKSALQETGTSEIK